MWQRAQIGKSEWKSWQVVPLCFPPPHTHSLTLSHPPLASPLSLARSVLLQTGERGHIQDEKQVSQEKCESLYAFSWYQHQLPLSLCCPSPIRLFSLCLLSTSVSFPFLHCVCVCVSVSLFTNGLACECVFASVC